MLHLTLLQSTKIPVGGEGVKVPKKYIEIYEQVKSLTYITHPLFDREEAKSLLNYELTDDPNAFAVKASKVSAANADLTAYLRSLAAYGVLKSSAEQKLFLKFNYLKHLIKQIDLKTSKDFKRVKELYDKMTEVRDLLVLHNLRLVVTIAKTFRVNSLKSFEDHISDGHLWIFKAVDNFDVSRGYKFSTYLVWSLRMNYWKSNKKRKKDMPPLLSLDEALVDKHHLTTSNDPVDGAALADNIRAVKDAMGACLSDKERLVLIERFGLYQQEVSLLLEIGNKLGLSRERIRQIQTEALNKLRTNLVSPI